MPAQTSIAFKTFVAGMKPPEGNGAEEWCNKNVLLPHSARSPKFDLSQTPWLSPIMEACADNSNKEVVVVAPTGSGKTTIFEGLGQWIICEESGGTMIVMQNDAQAKRWFETRMKPSMKINSQIKPLWPEDKNKVRKETVVFPHMPILVGGANLGFLQSESMRWVIGDEVWLWKAGMIDEARRRTHDRWNARVILVSQGSNEGDDFHQAFEQTNKTIFSWQCEECEAWNPWAFPQIIYDKIKNENGEYNWAAIEASAHLHCPKCKHKYEDKATVRRRLSQASKYISSNSNSRPGHIGFTYEVTAVWWIPWGQLAVEWLKADLAKKKGATEPRDKFLQKRRAKFLRRETEEVKSRLISSDYSKADYLKGEMWPGETYRIMTVDVQRDHFWYVIRAWKTDGSSRLLTEGKALTWEQLVDLSEIYNLRSELVGVDSQHRTGEVYDKCAEYDWNALTGTGYKEFTHIKADGQKIKKFFSPLQQTQSPAGNVCFRINWSNEKIKDLLVLLRSGQSAAWEVPRDISESYTWQIDSEVKREKVMKNGGTTMEYVRIRKDNHLWDCEAMNTLLAHIAGLVGTSAAVD